MSNPKEGNTWIPGGNSGVIINGVPYSNKGGSCIRKIMLRNEGINEPIDFRSKITFGVGEAIEDLYAEHLVSKGHTVEKSVRTNNMIDDKIIYLDETDMVVDGIPCEIKSVVSTNKLREVFAEGKWSWDNLVQAAHHMIMLKSLTGKLVYICATWHSFTSKGVKYSFKSGDIKEFDLKFCKKTGQLLVDSKATPFGTKNLMLWKKIAGSYVASKDLDAPTPQHPGVLLGDKRPPEFEDAICRWCFWNQACAAAAATSSSSKYSDFIFVARELAGGVM